MKKKVVKEIETAPDGIFNVDEQIILKRLEHLERRQLLVEKELIEYKEKLNELLQKLLVFIKNQKIINSIPVGESLKKHKAK